MLLVAIAKENVLMLRSVIVLDLMAVISHMCAKMVAGEICAVGLMSMTEMLTMEK